MQIGGVEDQLANSQRSMRMVVSELIDDPLSESYCQIYVVLKVTKQVCGPHEVTDVKDAIADDEVVAQCAWDSLPMNCSCIFGEP